MTTVSTVQREYKDRLFNFLFGSEENKAWTLSLYNAINHTEYTNVEEVNLFTIENKRDSIVSCLWYDQPLETSDGFPFDTAVDIIRKESGTHFDPEVVDAFLLCKDEARRIAEQANQKSLEEY